VVFYDGEFVELVIMPYLRAFLANRKAASGFFGEVHIIAGTLSPFLGFGTGVGYKFVSNNNWVIELACSISRIIDNDNLFLAARLTFGRRF
jgi:hypothetical protein